MRAHPLASHRGILLNQLFDPVLLLFFLLFLGFFQRLLKRNRKVSALLETLMLHVNFLLRSPQGCISVFKRLEQKKPHLRAALLDKSAVGQQKFELVLKRSPVPRPKRLDEKR